jgi:hypothetical protein
VGTKEAHPLKISFCDNCRDFFPRGDSLERHCRMPPPAYCSATSQKASAKRRKTETAHDKDRARLERFLRTGDDIGETIFADN